MTFDNKTPSFTPPLEWISLRVPAKLNIYLQAGVLREDGYHDLTTVYQAIDLYDELKVILAQPGAGLTMTVSGSEGEGNKIPIDSQNLVIKAAGVLASKFKLEPALQFELVKRIPTEAGLGGGSADAAAALVACNAIWALGLTDEGLSAIGALVGEDVPFFIKGMMAIGVGHKQPLICLPTNTWTWYWVVGIHKVGLSTKDVFAAFDKLISSNRDEQQQEYQRRRLRCLEIPWSTTPPALLANYLSNDLEQAAIMLLPQICSALDAGYGAGALGRTMTGSGSTCAFLVRDDHHARTLATTLEAAGVFRKVVLATGPVVGVHVLDSSTT